jgi:hypothetical protein
MEQSHICINIGHSMFSLKAISLENLRHLDRICIGGVLECGTAGRPPCLRQFKGEIDAGGCVAGRG